MTVTELLAARATAGTAYATAAAALRSTMIELAAIDAALQNRGIAGDTHRIDSFNLGVRKVDPLTLTHPVYFPTEEPSEVWTHEIVARRDVLIAGVQS